MAASGGDQGVIPGTQAAGLFFAIKEQTSAACQDQYPFVLLLVVPFALRGSLPIGDDALDADRIRSGDGLKGLGGQGMREVGQYVADFRRHVRNSPDWQ
jgi:hypothetical protein